MSAGRPTGRPKTGGRRKGVPNRTTAEIRAAAQKHGSEMITELVRLATNATSEQARVAAIKEVLDRGYGKTAQPLTGEGGEGPVRQILRIERVIVDPANSDG
jgi:hypothetical protein